VISPYLKLNRSSGIEVAVAERKKIVTINGRPVPGVDVPIEESNERWSEVKLEDGTTLRVKMTVLSVGRADAEFDATGNPMYSVDMAPVIAVTYVPEHLRRKTN
jgi:hypothetical protein